MGFTCNTIQVSKTDTSIVILVHILCIQKKQKKIVSISSDNAVCSEQSSNLYGLLIKNEALTFIQLKQAYRQILGLWITAYMAI